MRISDDRYSRDRLRLDLALRFIHHEARTHTIRTWTGLTDDRIRKLYRTYLQEAGGSGVPRHRGKSPRQAAFFTRSLRMRREAGGHRVATRSAGASTQCCQASSALIDILPRAASSMAVSPYARRQTTSISAGSSISARTTANP